MTSTEHRTRMVDYRITEQIHRKRRKRSREGNRKMSPLSPPPPLKPDGWMDGQHEEAEKIRGGPHRERKTAVQMPENISRDRRGGAVG